jgi:HlyD family secretion protein
VDAPISPGNHTAAPVVVVPVAPVVAPVAPVAVPAIPAPAVRAAPSPEMIKTLGLGRGAKLRALGWRVAKYAALAAIVVAVVAGVQRWRRPAPAPTYRSVAITRGDLRVTVTATGRVQAATTVEVGAEVSGRIERLLVDENAPVTRGQLLAVIDDTQLEAALAQGQAQLAAARASVRQASVTVTELELSARRTTALADQALEAKATVESSQAALGRATAAHAVAVANARLAEAQVNEARSRLGKATIRSPIDGVVLARNVEPGQTVTAGFTTPVLFKLAEDLTRMLVKVDIDEADIGRVREGNLATFTVDAYPGREFTSRVLRLSNEPTITQNVVTYQGELVADNLDLVLRPGMTATATIITEVRHDVPLVANAALRFIPDGATSTQVPAGRGRLWLASGLPGAGLGAVPLAVEVETGATDGVSTELRGAAPAVATAVLVETEGAP